jgi:hypothetical protein
MVCWRALNIDQFARFALIIIVVYYNLSSQGFQQSNPPITEFRANWPTGVKR